MKIEEVPIEEKSHELDAKQLREEEDILREMENEILKEMATPINTAINEFAEYPKDPVPVKKSPPVKKPPVSNIRKISTGAGMDVKKLLRDVILTRKSPAPVIPEVPEAPKRPSFVERKFGAVPVEPVKKEPPKQEKQPEPSPDPDPFKMKLNPPEQDIFDQEPVIKTRTKPLPPVVMPKRQSFWERVLSIKIIAKLNRKAKSKSLSKRRDISTGMTARQRIKRYNSIHEGGYGAPKEDEPTTEAS